MRGGLFTAALLLCLGCSHTYQVKGEGGTRGEVKISRESSFLVGIPADGTYGEHYYEGSGLMTTGELVRALKPHARKVQAAEESATRERYLEQARAEHLDYLIVPAILHWEERATEWSGRPDRIEIMLTLVEVSSGRTLDETNIVGKSRWATFGGDHPQELLPVPCEQYAAALFQ
ncbi:MAG: DUF4823 domain-containing protein [Myxococcota bacterium]|nr:DUF4823 domain-containing protein [Myxococcota bacterium]